MKIFVLKLWEWLFLAFVFLLPWQTRLILRSGILNNGNWEYGILGVYGTEMLLWLIVMIWGIEKVKEQNIKYWILNIKILIKKISNIQYPISLISLISLILLSLFVSSDKMVVWQSWRYITEAIIVFFLIRRHSRTGWLIGAFLSGLTVQSIMGIWQFLSQSAFASRWLGLTLHPAWQAGSAVLENSAGRWLRAYGGLPHPNILGGYLVAGLILIIVGLQITNFYKYKNKILLFGVYCLLLTTLFFTFSRGAWIAWFIGLLVCWFINWRKKIIFKSFNLLIFSSILLFTIYCLLFVPLLSSRLSGEGRLEVQSTSERISGYSEAWQLFKKHPLIGVGLGNYTLAIHQELDSSRSAWDYQPVHNVFLLMTVELGIVGLVFFCLFIFYFGKILNISPYGGSPAGRQYPIFILFFILGLFDHYLWSLYSGWMLLAVGGGLALSGQAKDAKI